jgi:membrane peptidoglycan carboxypeptidase
MVNAYSALANNGVQYPATVIDYVQDRNGKVIWRGDKRRCDTCNMAEWDGKPMPRIERRGKQVIDAETAYQVVHMLEGVVTRGTAVRLRDLDLPLFGKTGTTNGPTNVWFIGGSQDLVGGVYLGYDSAALAGRLCARRAHRRADLQGCRPRHKAALERPAVYRAGRYPYGPDRPRSSTETGETAVDAGEGGAPKPAPTIVPDASVGAQ